MAFTWYTFLCRLANGILNVLPQFAEPGSNIYSTAAIDWNPLGTYTGGDEIEMIVVMNANHWVSDTHDNNLLGT